ncbi:hypothetical protein KFK09_028491 [Dendrobium nobile]|uniref:Uncharacterized protein n=1 Tax=Dendrobium nobile TaxID=94219 RepID=A0A8T3A3F9_DENNO|nr:hypothetical protein KFK09_028491 [Dendrobium nobile]
MASARAWLLVASLAFLLIASVAEAQTLSPTKVPTVSEPISPHSKENEGEFFLPEQSAEEVNVFVDLTEVRPEDYQRELVVLGH